MNRLHLFLFFLTLATLLFSCSEDDNISAVVCEPDCGVNGVCNEGACICINGFEGEDCSIESNAKFLGVYDTDYSGFGGLASSGGNTSMAITEGDNAGKITINIPLELGANLPQIGAVDLPIDLTIQADIVENSYSIPSTTIGFSIPVAGFNLPISITFEGTGNLSGSTLNSSWTFSGLLLNGNVNLVGNK